MRRRNTKVELEELFARLRKAIPDVVIRTSLICGLPGEGEAEFEELCEFLKEQKLPRRRAPWLRRWKTRWTPMWRPAG